MNTATELQPAGKYKTASARRFSGKKSSNQGKRSLVMLVNDLPDARSLMRDIVGRCHRTIEAENGSQALTLARESKPDLILTDIVMPVMDGVEMCRRLKADELTSHIPVIMLAAFRNEADQIRGLEAGAEGFLSEPYNPSILMLKIKNYLAAARRLRQRYFQLVGAPPDSPPLVSADELFLQKAVAVVDKHMAMPEFDAARFAKAMAISRSGLYRKLQSVTGQSVNLFVRLLRMKRASQLLASGQLSISEAAYRVGFLDPSYFSYCFKKQFGMPPSDYAALRQAEKGDETGSEPRETVPSMTV